MLLCMFLVCCVLAGIRTRNLPLRRRPLIQLSFEDRRPPGRTRTCSLWGRNPLLFQLSYERKMLVGVRVEGVEPSRGAVPHQILSLARLPTSPHPREQPAATHPPPQRRLSKK